MNDQALFYESNGYSYIQGQSSGNLDLYSINNIKFSVTTNAGSGDGFLFGNFTPGSGAANPVYMYFNYGIPGVNTSGYPVSIGGSSTFGQYLFVNTSTRATKYNIENLSSSTFNSRYNMDTFKQMRPVAYTAQETLAENRSIYNTYIKPIYRFYSWRI